MSGITIATGAIDVQTLADQLSSIDQIPITKMQSKISSLGTRTTAMDTLKSDVSALEQAASAVGDPINRGKLGATITISDSTALAASVTASVVSGTHQLTVSQLASNHRVVSSSFASATAALQAGSLSFDIGTWSGGIFAAKSGSSSYQVTIAGGDTLSTLVDKINADASAPVSAALVNNGTTGYQLVFSAKSSGASNQMRIQSVANPSLTFDGTANSSLSQIQAGQDANFVLDGLAMSRSDNTITDAVQGVSFTLGKTSASPITMSVGIDPAKIKAALTNFATALSGLISDAKRLSPTGQGTSGPLQGEAIVSQVVRTVKNAFFSSGSSGGVRSFGELGLQFGKDGSVSLNSAVFDKAFQNNPQDVTNFIGSSTMDSFLSTVRGVMSVSGPIAARKSGVGKEVARLNKQVADMQAEATKKRTQYVKMYTALNTNLTKLQQQGNALVNSLGLNNTNTTGA